MRVNKNPSNLPKPNDMPTDMTSDIENVKEEEKHERGTANMTLLNTTEIRAKNFGANIMTYCSSRFDQLKSCKFIFLIFAGL